MQCGWEAYCNANLGFGSVVPYPKDLGQRKHCQTHWRCIAALFGRNQDFLSDAAFWLTAGSFLLTMELFYLQLTILAFYLQLELFAYNFSFFAYSWSFLLTVGAFV